MKTSMLAKEGGLVGGVWGFSSTRRNPTNRKKFRWNVCIVDFDQLHRDKVLPVQSQFASGSCC